MSQTGLKHAGGIYNEARSTTGLTIYGFLGAAEKTLFFFSADKAPPGIRSKSGLTTVFTTDKHGTRGNSGRKKLGEQVSWSGNGMKARKAHERTDPRQLGW